MSDHTPGPWFVSGVRFKMNGQEWISIIKYDENLKRDENIALVGFDSRTGLGSADARLIARAPEMAAEITRLTARVEELEGALAKMQRSRDRYRQAWEAEKVARAAITKGESND